MGGETIRSQAGRLAAMRSAQRDEAPVDHSQVSAAQFRRHHALDDHPPRKRPLYRYVHGQRQLAGARRQQVEHERGKLVVLALERDRDIAPHGGQTHRDQIGLGKQAGPATADLVVGQVGVVAWRLVGGRGVAKVFQRHAEVVGHVLGPAQRIPVQPGQARRVEDHAVCQVAGPRPAVGEEMIQTDLGGAEIAIEAEECRVVADLVFVGIRLGDVLDPRPDRDAHRQPGAKDDDWQTHEHALLPRPGRDGLLHAEHVFPRYDAAGRAVPCGKCSRPAA